MTALDIITGALQEINAVAQGENPSTGDSNFALTKLNDLLDEWSARKFYIYDESFPVYTLQAGLLPHTIGPQGQLTASIRVNDLATFTQANQYANGDNVTVNSTNGFLGIGSVVGRVQNATQNSFAIASVGPNVPPAPDRGISFLTGTTPPTFGTPNSGPRPQKVEQANLILNMQNPATDLPLNIRDSDWWMNQRVKNLQSNVPTDLYYDPNFPNGSLYFWPVPDTNYQCRLKLWGTIPQFPALNYRFSLPPGYQKAIKLSLARDMVGPFQGSWGAQQEDSWKRAMKAVTVNNTASPRAATLDAGMPRPTMSADFNWETGLSARY